MRRLLFFALLLALTGCGSRANEPASAEAAVSAFTRRVNAQDWPGACRLLVAPAHDCAQRLEREIPADTLPYGEDGDAAGSGQFTLTTAGAGQAQRASPTSSTLSARKVHGRWRVAIELTVIR